MTATELAVDLWKSTLEAHDRQWGHYALLAFGILAFLATVRDPHTAHPLIRRALFFGVLVFMLVSAVTMCANLVIHNDATRAIRADQVLGPSPAFASVGEMSPVKNTVIHLAFDLALVSILAVYLFPDLFRRSGDRGRPVEPRHAEPGAAPDPGRM